MSIHYPAALFETNELRTIKLHGALGNEFGTEIKMAATTPREVVRALMITRPGFREAMRDGHFYLVLGDEEKGLDIAKDNIDLSISVTRTLHIIPAAEGRKKGVGKLLAGIALIGLAVVTGGTALMAAPLLGVTGMTLGGTVMLAGLGLAIGGLATMLAPTPKLPDYSDRESEPVSYLMNGVVNNVEEGGAVPVALGGPIMVGSHVVSSGIDIDDANLTGGYQPPIEWNGGIPSFGDWINPESQWNQYRNQKFNDQPNSGIDAYKSGKGGGSARAAREQSTTVTSEAVARVLDLISAGPIEGWADPEHPFRNVFLDDTVVENSDGTQNFRGLNLDFRQGTPGQDYIGGFGQTESAVQVGVGIQQAFPATRLISSDPATGLAVNRVKVIMSFPALSQQDKSTGDVNGASVSYRIGIIPNGGAVQWVVNQTLNEKFTSPYQKAHTVTLPDTGHPYQIRVQRLTPDSDSVALQNETRWDAYVEIIDAKLSYPGCALVGLTAYASQFGDRIPKRGYLVKGVVCEVPSNYDPITRTYTGVWDGTLVSLWTNNPAWILWSILTNPEWGLGKRIPRQFVDKWSLYEIGRYCDEFVSDGLELAGSYTGTASKGAVHKARVKTATRTPYSSGSVVGGVTLAVGDRVLLMGQQGAMGNGIYTWNGSSLTIASDMNSAIKRQYALVTVEAGEKKGRAYLQVNSASDQATKGVTFVSVEPRFAFNMWISSRESVYKAVQTIASSFRGLLVWGRGMVLPVQDAPKTPRRLISNANVHGGAFTYEGLGRKSIHTVALVSWINPDDNWKAAVEVVENPELIAKYGWRTTDIFAAGCTSRAQAKRMGSWALYTEEFESEMVSFKGSFELADIVPGDVIMVADNDQIGIRMSGRLKRGPSPASQNSVTLDAPFDFKVDKEYMLYMTGPSGAIHQRPIETKGLTDTVEFDIPMTGDYPQSEYNSVYIVTSTDIEPRLFRVMAMTEHEANEIEVIAAEHYPQKYDYVEEGIGFDPRENTVYDSTVPPAPPTDCVMTRTTVLSPAGPSEEIVVQFRKSVSPMVSKYKVSWRAKSGTWNLLETARDNFNIPFTGPGAYEVSITGVDILGRETTPLSHTETYDGQRSIGVSLIQNLRIKGKEVEVSDFHERSLRVEWDVRPPAGFGPEVLPPVAEDHPDYAKYISSVEKYDLFLKKWRDPYFRDYEITIYNALAEPKAFFYSATPYFEISSDKYYEAMGEKSRDISLGVRLRDTADSETEYTDRIFSNPPPDTDAVEVTVDSNMGEIFLTYIEPEDSDYAGLIVWANEASAVPILESRVVFDGRGMARFKWPSGTTAFVRWAFYDTFGKTDLNVSVETEIISQGVDVGDIQQTVLDIVNPAVASIQDNLDSAKQQLEAAQSTMFDQITSIEGQIKLVDPTAGSIGARFLSVEQITENSVTRIDGMESILGTSDSTGIRASIISMQGVISNLPTEFASATDVSNLKTEVTNARGGEANLSAQLSSMRQAVTDGLGGKASVTDVSSLGVRVTDAESDISAQNTRLDTVTADLAGKASSSSVTSLANEISGARNGKPNLGAELTSMRQTVTDGLNGKASASDLNSLTTRVSAAETTNTAQNQRLDTVESDVAGKASATSVSTLAAEIANARGGQLNLNARFTQVNQAITDSTNGMATASSVSLLTSTVNGHTSSISTLSSTTATLEGKINAKYGVLLGAGNKIAGFQINATTNSSSFDILADNFRLSPSNGAGAVSPFEVIGTTVYMRNTVWRSAATGARTEQDANGMRVYDASRLRVRVGIW